VQHVHSQWKADVESHGHSKEKESSTDDDSHDGFDRLSGDDVRQLFVKNRNRELTFFCDLGELFLKNRNGELTFFCDLGELFLKNHNGELTFFCELDELFVKNCNGELTFFCDLDELFLFAVKAVLLCGPLRLHCMLLPICLSVSLVLASNSRVTESSELVGVFLLHV